MLTCCWGRILKNGEIHVNFHEWPNSGIDLRKGLRIALMCLELGPVYRILILTFFFKGVEVHARE